MADPTESDPGEAIDDLEETVVASRVLHQGRYLTFRIDTVERADGSRAERDVAGHPGAVAILAVDPDGGVLLVRQYRSPAGRVLLEIPAGTLDADPATGLIEDHALAARRELEEETGYRAGTWRHLTSFWTAPGFATELMHLWLATDLRPADGERLGPDEDEHLRLDRLPVGEAVAAVERGEIADAKSIVGLLWLERLNAGVAAAATDAITVTYRLRLAEYLGAIAVLSRHSRGLQVFGTLIALSGLFGLVVGTDPLSWLPPLAGGLLIMSGLFMTPFAWFTARRRRELIEQPIQFIADSSGLTHITSYGRNHLGWQVYVRVRELGDWFFLDTGAGASHFVPKRAFSAEDLAAFRKLLADAGFGMNGRRRGPTA